MWKVLAPLIVLIVVLIIQMQLAESFVGSSTDASGNKTDASGNKIDSSGNAVPTTITLSLADLLTLFKASTPKKTEEPTTTTIINSESTQNPSDFYSEIRPELIKDIKGIVSTQLAGSPYLTDGADSCSDAPCSDSAAQGLELQNAMKNYVKKDEIPCWGCSL